MAHNKEVAMCRSFFAFLFILCVMIVSGDAKAKPGIQAIVAASASAPVGNEFTLDLFANQFITPGNHPMSFYYIGASRNMTPWWWASLRTGFVMNWPDVGGSAPIISVWNSINFDPRDCLFTETEVYLLSDGGVDYYGFYAFDHSIDQMWQIGVQGEQVNKSFIAGPHIGINLGEHVSTTVLYFWGSESSAVRVNLVISI